MTIAVIIGTWHERAPREFTRCPSYYAADTETLRVKPGEYLARITFEGGYTIPMPYWLLIGIDTERVEGRLYSGCGGLNFAVTELKAGEAVRYTIQQYRYQIREAVESGWLTLKPEFEWLNCGAERACWDHSDAPKTWDDVRRLAS